jgi:hypothetical protein
MRSSVGCCIRTSPTALAIRSVTGLFPTSTIRLRPSSSKWLVSLMVAPSRKADSRADAASEEGAFDYAPPPAKKPTRSVSEDDPR